MPTSDPISVERLEALLHGDAPQTADESRRAALLTGLRDGVLRAPEELRTRVLAAAPATRAPRWVAFPRRRLVLVALPAAVGLAVAAAAIHGIVGSGSGRSAAQPVTAEKKALGKARALTPATVPSSSAGAAATPSATTAAPSVGSGSRLQRTDASLEVRVADGSHLAQATTKATRIVASLGGYAESVVFDSSSNGGGDARLDLRVPAENVQKAIVRLEGLGTLVSQELSVQDLQHQLTTQSEEIAALRRRVAALEKALKSEALPDAQRVLLRIKLAEARRSLTQSIAARKGTLESGATASISLVLSTRPSPAAVVHHRGRLGRMLHSAAGFLALEGTIALYALVVLAPLLVVGILAWGALAVRRRREERRLLAA
jgi:Domain of unknown function (DUF4349)